MQQGQAMQEAAAAVLDWAAVGWVVSAMALSPAALQ